MTTRGFEDLDGGLGSCLPSDDFPLLEEPRPGRRPDSKARGTSKPADSSTWTQVLQDPATAGTVDIGPKKMERELVAKESDSAGPSKAGASPRSVPARKKSQAAPPLKPPPPPPPPPPPSSDDLPWGDLTLNKCLVLASLVALLGSAFQLCRDAVTGEAAAAAVAAPQQWVPPSSPLKKPVSPAPKSQVSVPPSGQPEPKPVPPGPQAQIQVKPELPGSPEATEGQGEPGESTPEVSGEESSPLGDRGSQEKLRKEKPRKGEKLKKEKPRREKPRREERPRATREPRQSLPRRWEAREGGPRPGRRDSREFKREKRQAWAPQRLHDRDNRPRQKHRGGKGRD